MKKSHDHRQRQGSDRAVDFVSALHLLPRIQTQPFDICKPKSAGPQPLARAGINPIETSLEYQMEMI